MRLLLRFLKPYKGLMAATLFALLLDVAGALFVPTILAQMINVGAEGGTEHILPTGLIMLAVTVVSGLGALVGSWLCAKLCANVGRDMRNAIYDATLKYSDGDFKEFGTGSMITRTLNDVNVIQMTVMMSFQMLIPVPIMCVMGITLSFMIDATMGWVLLAALALVVALTVVVVVKAAPIFDRLQRFIDRMNTVLRENITGVRVIRAFGRERHESKRLDKSFSDYATSAIHVNLLFAGLDSMSFFFINIVIVAVMWLGGDQVAAHAMQIGDITALIEYSILILFYVMMAGFVMFMVPRAFICLGRAKEVIDREPEIKDPEEEILRLRAPRSAQDDKGNALRSAQDDKELTCHPEQSAAHFPCHPERRPEAGVEGSRSVQDCHPERAKRVEGSQPAAGEKTLGEKIACFDHLSFRFADGAEDTLQDLTFSCKRGQTTAIIGPTGSGKSTIARLMLRLIDATDGRVLIGGVDVRDMTQRELRDHIAYVPQKAWLFSGTIAENLRYGNPNATDEELWHALDVAQGSFVRELPDGLNSRVSQGGTNFSGGQRQRLAIARALVKKTDLYIFDDSFSALDFATDAALRRALAEEPAMREAAMLIIAQRVSTIVHADQIVVLEDGKVKGRGTHAELMRDCPTYQEIARSQMKAGDDATDEKATND